MRRIRSALSQLVRVLEPSNAKNTVFGDCAFTDIGDQIVARCVRWTQQKPFAGQMTDWVFDYSFNNFIVFEGDLHPDFPGGRPVLIKTDLLLLRISFERFHKEDSFSIAQ
jgi:hypothetical protein